MPDIDLSTLEEIRIKVRRLTKSPSTSQITDASIDKYINTFVLYDFPEELRLSTLEKTLTFYTDPYIDTYTTSYVPTDPLYNFKNKYVSVQSPIYVGGKLVNYSQSQAAFYANYPLTESQTTIATGNGITVAYAGTLTSKPVLRNKVLFSSVDINNAGLKAYDDGAGNLTGDIVAGGTINYITGVYAFTFNTAPANGTDIKSSTIPYTPTIPTSVLYFNNEFILRPVPDRPYRVEVSVYERPTELLAGSMPELAQWYQYIAYGAAIKILQDRMDMDMVTLLQPEFDRQELLVNRRTINQQTEEQVATIWNSRVTLDDFEDWPV